MPAHVWCAFDVSACGVCVCELLVVSSSTLTFRFCTTVKRVDVNASRPASVVPDAI